MTPSQFQLGMILVFMFGFALLIYELYMFRRDLTDLEQAFEDSSYVWTVNFELSDNVSDFDAAEEFFGGIEPSEQYTGVLKEHIISIRWILETAHSGKIRIAGNLPYLFDEFEKDMTAFINSQHAEGIGNRFKQQSFAKIKKNNKPVLITILPVKDPVFSLVPEEEEEDV